MALLSDFVRVPYANGAVFQTRILYQMLRAAGHEVTLIAPGDPEAAPSELAPGTIALPSLRLPAYPGFRLPLPPPRALRIHELEFDIALAQTNSLLMYLGIWLREARGVPLLCVNTTNLAQAYEALMPAYAKRPFAHALVEGALLRPYEALFASMYNASDGLVVLSEGLRDYWQSRGVTVPIHVVPRAIPEDVYDGPATIDPYPALIGPELAGVAGRRLLCAGRLSVEKSQDRLIRIFAEHVLPAEPGATLTLVGQGPDREMYRRLAREHGVGHRVFFAGEVGFADMPAWYAHADVFVHASLSETFGNVLGEALWSGRPAVAFADGMGVSSQIIDGVNGILLEPGDTDDERREADRAFGATVVELVRDERARAALGKAASRISHKRNSPRAIEQRLVAAFDGAREHATSRGLRAGGRRSWVRRWAATTRRFTPWIVTHLAITAWGHLRKVAPAPARAKHPLIWR